MTRLSRLAAISAAILSGACDMRLTDDEDNPSVAVEAPPSAEGKAQEGKISIKAPGFDLALSIPREVAREARPGDDSKILYPGVRIGGIHVAAGEGGGNGGRSELEMRFTSADPPQKVLAWYRDPARAKSFTLSGSRAVANGFVVEGTQKGDDHGFRVNLGPGDAGGTSGRLNVQHGN